MNVNAAWVVTALVAGAAVTYAFVRPAKASVPACSVNEKSLSDWASAEGYASIWLYSTPPPPPSATVLVKQWVSLSLVTGPVVVVCSDGSFWYYADTKTDPVRRDDLRAKYCSAQKGTTAGHPASAFMVQ